MPKVNEEWIVRPHGPLEECGEAILAVTAEIVMPLGRFPRRMTVVGLGGGRTAIWSAIPLREPDMARIENLGEPSVLIVPGIGHKLDIKPWKQRYPKARVLCPAGAREAVEAILPVDATTDVLEDPSVSFETVPGVGGKEAALIVRREAGTTLVVNDILANVRHPHGMGAHIMARLLGFGVRQPEVPRTGRWMFVDDKAALAGAFRRWAQEPALTQIIVSHGEIIAAEPRAVLERVARSLDGRRSVLPA
jgi:hypothetical protein